MRFKVVPTLPAPRPLHGARRPAQLERLARDLVRGALLELYLTPKPGLVDQANSGSHHDLSIPCMEASLAIVSRYLHALAAALAGGTGMDAQVRLGQAAEREMLERLGTNSHRGYIFLSGLFLSARSQLHGVQRRDEAALCRALVEAAHRFFARGEEHGSNGSRVRSRYRAGGIRAEALAGLPSLFQEALPAFRNELASGGNRGSAVYAMLGRLMQSVEDTTALHRCGRVGLAILRADGRTLERLVAERGDFPAFLAARNAHYVRRNLTMGGVADMLGIALAWLSHTGELPS